MSSQKPRAFSFGSKRSQSISTSKPASPSPSDTLKTKRSQFAMLASLPFRYAFTNSMLIKQTSLIHSSDVTNIQQHTYQSSNLIKNSIDESTSEVGVSEENLIKQPSFSSSDIDDYKPVSLIFNREDMEKTVGESHPAFADMLNEVDVLNEEDDNLVEDTSGEVPVEECDEWKTNDSRIMNNFTLPNNLSDDLASAMRKTAIRRHHSAPQSEAKWLQAKRKAIVVQMYDTEKSYVEALKILVTKYYLPLKEKDIVDRNLINDIFYKIPEIHVHHELLLSSLKSKFDTWDTRQTIGDLLLNILSKQSVIETYISFVNNYHTSQQAIRICKDQSSLFSKFIEQQAKEHRGKLTLKDLIIQPVQRIPRYELYIKDFLKCTPFNHSDYSLLTKASKELHNLAEKIDQVHKELHESYGTDSQSVLQIVQDLIENLDDLVNAYRYYIRHDMITVISPTGVKKDRCLFLFSDLLIITSCKRRSGNINKRANSIILNSPIGKQYLESIKYKYIMKFQLEDIELTGTHLGKKLSFEKDFLEEDLSTITRINELAKQLVYPHQNLDESIKEITASIIYQLNDTSTASNALNSGSNADVNSNLSVGNNLSVNVGFNLKNSSVDSLTPQVASGETIKQKNKIILTINTQDRVEAMTVVFGHADQRLSWEKCFIEAKKIFFESSSRKPAKFLNVIAIPRNRSGVQFTCASARIHLTNNPNDVWICSTDGQMGQVCIMNTFPELTISSCNTVCNSRITCIQCVPPFCSTKSISSKSQYKPTNQLIQQAGRRLEQETSLLNYDSSDDDEETESQSGYEVDVIHEISPTNLQIEAPTITTAQATVTAATSSNENNIPMFNNNGATYIQDTTHSTMWIGNDDGSLHIFQFCDSAVRTVSRKNRFTKQFSSSIQSIVYIDNKVFVSLKNGELAIFTRSYSFWNYDSYTIKTLSQNSFGCMLAVAGKLWCASKNTVSVLSPSLITIEHQFSIEGEQSILLAIGGSSSWAIWVASQNSLDLRLYHATKFTLLAEINIRNVVTQKLASLDELIRIHKLACLKITCLYVCKDTLWVGTSAGIICNVKTPHINNTTTKLTTALNLKALNNGHFGPVRFITSTEILKNPPGQGAENTETIHSSQNYKTVAISGGEGYEVYKNTVSLSMTYGGGNVSSTSSNLVDENSGSNAASSLNLVSSSTLQPYPQVSSYNNTHSSSNMEDPTLGKDDLINYVLTWEI